jgi:Acetyltransferase (GNAT) domain/Acetyltransferase (GNAT) family
MPRPSDLEVRVMRRDELDVALEWAEREGWNPGLADADCFHAADPGGFLLGCLRGEPVGCISVVRYGDNFGFLGFYIVKPKLRGRGYGLDIWQAGMARLHDRVVGLDGVIAQQENYRRSGFVLAHRNVRFGGIPRFEQTQDPRLTPIGPELKEAVMAYDRGFFPANRGTFLRCWLRPQQRKALALVEDRTVRGYGVIRACRKGFKIGPLFADTDEGADLLLRALAGSASGELVFLDCPEPNKSATALALRCGLSPVFETARMYRGAVPGPSISRTYGITTFELG